MPLIDACCLFKCECVPAEWLDEEALVFRERDDYTRETHRRDRLEREGGSDEHLPPLCLITHFYCSKSKVLMPSHAVEDRKQVGRLTAASAVAAESECDQRQRNNAVRGSLFLAAVDAQLQSLPPNVCG